MSASVLERARAYVAKYCPPGISGTNRHAATFYAASVIVNGFALGEDDAWALLCEFNRTCQPPSDEKKLRYRLKRAMATGSTAGKGYLLKGGNFYPSKREQQLRHLAGTANSAPPAAPEKVEFDPEALARIAAPWRHVDLIWLADRSQEDPALVSTDRFLKLLYQPHERVKIFTKQMSQGQAVWPCPGGTIPGTGPLGVWFLAAPVDGREYVNPRSAPGDDGKAKMSARSEESVTSWRWMVVESDEANTRDWLGCMVQMPLKLAALYTSGGRSVHALIQVDARTKSEWDAYKAIFKPWLVKLGADPGSLSAVRLTRLPGCWREGKIVENKATGEKSYVSLKNAANPNGAFQKLLYINPNPQLRPVCEMARLRDTESAWLQRASQGVGDSDETGGEWIDRGLWYYAPVSKQCAEARVRFQKALANG